jgi:hypothetical protein
MMGRQERAEELEAAFYEVSKGLAELKEQQSKQTEKMKELVQIAGGIGKAVVCGEMRQDAWTGVLINYLYIGGPSPGQQTADIARNINSLV